MIFLLYKVTIERNIIQYTPILTSEPDHNACCSYKLIYY